MPAVLSKDNVWTLWSSSMPGEPPSWHHQDTGAKDALERKALSLRRLFTNRRFLVVPGLEPPRQ